MASWFSGQCNKWNKNYIFSYETIASESYVEIYRLQQLFWSIFKFI